MNIYDDMKADEKRTECQHLWVISDDRKSIRCHFCGLVKIIQEGTKLE